MSTVALVLGAGGVTGGAFHAGVLAALHDALGWDARTADLVVGTSAGSVTAAGLRAGFSPRDLLARAVGEALSDEAAAILRAAGATPTPPPVPGGARVRLGRPAAPEVLVAAARRPWQVRPTAVLAALLPAGTVPTAMITDGMNALHHSWPAKPMWVCAVRLTDAALVVFGRDDTSVTVGEAVAASCAIPGYFQPVDVGGARYIDGGAHSLTNVGEVAAGGFDLVVVSAPMALGQAQLAVEVQRARRRGANVVTFRPTADDRRVMGANAMDARRRAATARRVHESALRRLGRPDIRARLEAMA